MQHITPMHCTHRIGAVGTTNDEHKAVKAYHRLLVWDIVKGPKLTRWAEKILNPIFGKSFIVYLSKAPTTTVQQVEPTLERV